MSTIDIPVKLNTSHDLRAPVEVARIGDAELRQIREPLEKRLAALETVVLGGNGLDRLAGALDDQPIGEHAQPHAYQHGYEGDCALCGEEIGSANHARPDAADKPAPAGEIAAPNKGDYVLATKYEDGEAWDWWGLGWLDSIDNGRFMVIDSEGKQTRGNGYRRCRKISKECGNWLWARREELERTGAKLWDLVASFGRKQTVAQPGADEALGPVNLNNEKPDRFTIPRPVAQPDADEAADKVARCECISCDGTGWRWSAVEGGTIPCSTCKHDAQVIASLRARVAELAGKLADYERPLILQRTQELLARTAAERDKALARVAELELSQVRICGERDCAQDERDKALAELATVTKQRDWQIQTNEGQAMRHGEDVAKLKAELAAERERREKAEACGNDLADSLHAAQSVRQIREDERDAARAEADALLAEVAAMKARKVKLEAVYEAASALATGQDWNNGTMAKTHGYRQKLIDAIRAVGGEVAL